jgi:hypothetical protein
MINSEEDSMPALDKCHDAVIGALEKVGWETNWMLFIL